jgi:ligand-binding sensor domain-containing protein
MGGTLKLSAWILVGCLLSLLICRPASALDPNRKISQYGHTAWRVQDGAFTGAIATIAQTANGYIWIGTVNGLVQFDGVRFVAWKSAKGQSLPRPRITALLGARDGSLWIGTSGGLSQLKDGDLFNFPRTSGIAKIIEDQSGTIWLTRYAQTDGGGPLCRVDGQKLQCFDKTDGIPAEWGVGLSVDSLGNFWIGSHTLCQWKPGEVARTYFQKELSHTEAGVLELAAGPNGSMWAALEGTGRDLGVRHFVGGAWTSYEVGDFHGALVHAQALFLDRENALWVGTLNEGLYRIHDGVAERYRSADGRTRMQRVPVAADHPTRIVATQSRGCRAARTSASGRVNERPGLTGFVNN